MGTDWVQDTGVGLGSYLFDRSCSSRDDLNTINVFFDFRVAIV